MRCGEVTGGEVAPTISDQRLSRLQTVDPWPAIAANVEVVFTEQQEWERGGWLYLTTLGETLSGHRGTLPSGRFEALALAFGPHCL